jgi:DNA polymerase II large subunit
MDGYNKILKDGLQKAYAVAIEARKKGYDPVDDVEVRITTDLAARVENIVGPPNIAKIIREMEAKGISRTDIAFEIARKIAAGEIFKANREFLIEQAVRTGVGLLTEGVLVAPTEGIAKIKIKKNPDGSDYTAVYYAGPIRSAGGTAAALSLVLADIARRTAGVGDYRATDSQIERYVEEISVYEARVTHLQYYPPEEDIRTIVKNCPVCIDGDPTEEIEVSAYKGVPGVETDRVRGGVPLVICEGVALKAAKLLKYTRKLKLGWNWLEDIIKIKARADRIEIKPDSAYLDGLVAGRPVFSYPSAKGGFRLRYGRSETNGLMGKNVHAATMTLLDGFLAYGTHMKIERPGKGCVVIPHSGIEPPVVKLFNGQVMKVRTVEEAEKIKSEVEEILFLGDILSTYGDFLKSNHPLVPSGYCREIWKEELKEKDISPPAKINAEDAFEFSRNHDVPLHPDYTYPWHDISPSEIKRLAEWLKNANLAFDGGRLKSLTLHIDKPAKRVLELLLAEHRVKDGRVILDGDNGYSILASLGALKDGKADLTEFEKKWNEEKDVLGLVNELSRIRIKAWAPTYIGARMGRPEKAKGREMAGKPNVLFPTGSFKNRSLSKQFRTLKEKDRERNVNIEIARFRCERCGGTTIYRRCHECGGRAKEEKICQKCGKTVEGDTHCDMKTVQYDKRPVELVALFEKVKTETGSMPEEIKGVKGLSNATRIPERLEKGFMRAKHGVYVFRDGTSRFDATDVTLTHFVPKEVGLSVPNAKGLGYVRDYKGNELKDEGQLVPLFPQDIILSDSGAEYLMRVASFIDDMLINLYGIKPFYNIKKKEDLIGHLCLGLSPHTSASVICRVIGFTKANIGYGHPYFHTAKRRNCDGDEDSVMLLLDALINFSKKYLDEKRGGTMDAPLVLTTRIEPSEVDDEAHSIELVSSYPLEFYKAAERITPASDVNLKTVKNVLGKEEQYGFTITHPGTVFSGGNTRTSYVKLETIPEKIATQFGLQERIRAVDKKDAASRLIMSHFIPDLYGNLRSYSRQTFRCVGCNNIYRRPPLSGRCARCGGNLLLTINKGGIEKYLQISREIAEKYELSDYTKQRLELIEKEIRCIFEDEKNKQMGLSDFL